MLNGPTEPEEEEAAEGVSDDEGETSSSDNFGFPRARMSAKAGQPAAKGPRT